MSETTTEVPLRDPRSFAIIGAAMEVHSELGPGFLEAVYHEALVIEFTSRGLPFAREPKLPVSYKSSRLTIQYRPDFVCFGAVIVELKAIKMITPIEEAQTINYLKTSNYALGLLINFGATSLQCNRFDNLKTSQPSTSKSV